MTPDIIARVDAWLADNGACRWLRYDWAEQASLWRHRDSKVTHPHRTRARESAEAALTGILLALVREAWGDPLLYCRHTSMGWCVVDGNGFLVVSGSYHATETEALTSCLEAAPAKEAAP